MVRAIFVSLCCFAIVGCSGIFDEELKNKGDKSSDEKKETDGGVKEDSGQTTDDDDNDDSINGGDDDNNDGGEGDKDGGEPQDSDPCVGVCFNPDGTDKECGPDGCGGSCGECKAGEMCVAGICKKEGNNCPADKNCQGRECGPDPVCGESCGTCKNNRVCEGGKCICLPNCDGKECGDDGCGGLCGSCKQGKRCENYKCVDGEVECPKMKDCTGRKCGPDPVCGESCGTCNSQPAAVCIDDYHLRSYNPSGNCSEGECVYGYSDSSCPFGCKGGACKACVPDCEDKECGDDGCGESCGVCPSAPANECLSDTTLREYEGTSNCIAGKCLYPSEDKVCDYKCQLGACVSCVTNCRGKNCGDDGCGGICGTCNAAPQPVCSDADTLKEYSPAGSCVSGNCEYSFTETNCPHGCADGACQNCAPQCAGKDCGPDGCGGNCGTCSAGYECDGSGVCQCVPNCTGKECGSDGCGGNCAPNTCSSPPQTTCVNSNTARRVYNSPGTCGTNGTCEYTYTDTTCEYGCTSGACNPCPPKTCAADYPNKCGTFSNGCGGNITCTCSSGYVCYNGNCCLPNCTNKQCGSNGCGGSCGTCNSWESCSNNQCVCNPNCSNRNCGTDGCGGSCGSCGINETCVNGICQTTNPGSTGGSLGSVSGGMGAGTCPSGQECSFINMQGQAFCLVSYLKIPSGAAHCTTSANCPSGYYCVSEDSPAQCPNRCYCLKECSPSCGSGDTCTALQGYPNVGKCTQDSPLGGNHCSVCWNLSSTTAHWCIYTSPGNYACKAHCRP